MKRLLSLILAALCLCSAVPAALAAGQVYEFPEFNMTIEAPEGWIVFTQDVKEDDPNLKLLGLDGKELSDNCKKKNIYLDMFSPDSGYEILVTMTHHSTSPAIHDFNNIPDEDMLPKAEYIMQGLQKQMEGQRTYYDCSVYTHKQTKFAIFHLSYQNNGVITYGKQYHTIINGQAINIMLYSYSNEISDELAQMLQNTVDSIYFTKITPKTAVSSTALAAGRVYELPEFNMTVEAPEGWIVFTHDIDENDPNLKLIGADAKGFSDFLSQNHIYLYIVKTDPLVKISLTILNIGKPGADFNKISDDALLPMIESAIREQEKNYEGTTFTNFSVYNHKQTKFVVHDAVGPIDGVMVYGKQYFTLINGQNIIIALQSYGSEVTDSLEETARDVVDSIYFTEVSSKPADITAVILVLAGIAAAAISIGIVVHFVRRARRKKLPPREIKEQSGLGNISLR